MTGEVISNVLFTGLLAALFFLIGIHVDIGELKNLHTTEKKS